MEFKNLVIFQILNILIFTNLVKPIKDDTM